VKANIIGNHPHLPLAHRLGRLQIVPELQILRRIHSFVLVCFPLWLSFCELDLIMEQAVLRSDSCDDGDVPPAKARRPYNCWSAGFGPCLLSHHGNVKRRFVRENAVVWLQFPRGEMDNVVLAPLPCEQGVTSRHPSAGFLHCPPPTKQNLVDSRERRRLRAHRWCDQFLNVRQSPLSLAV
jgi:hypothetical protein